MRKNGLFNHQKLWSTFHQTILLRGSTFHLSEVVGSEVISITNGLESKKTSGVDGIPVKFIKAEPNSIGRLVTRFVNSSVTSGIFPD